jgi:Zn-dependent protease/predicted transcriptional regulator
MRKILSFRVHYTWIFVFALVTAIVATQFSEDYPLLQKMVLGAIVFLLFFIMTAIRELVLSTAAFRTEAPASKTILFAFGGIHHENKDTIVTTHLPLLYLVRFLSNLVIAVVFWGLYATFINSGYLTMAGVVQWLAYIYILVFLLHFIPAFPLDGGEILRMVLRKSTGDYHKATNIASLIGLAVGLFMVFAGVLVFIILTQQWYYGLVIVLMGWIVQIAAGYTRREVKIHVALQNVRAENIMTAEYPAVSAQMNIGQLVREHILIKGWHYIMVVDGGQLKGILTLDQLKSLPGKRYNNTLTGDIMIPAVKLRTVPPRQTADTIFEDIYQRGLDYVPVMENDRVIGVVTREALMNLVKVRAGFGI